MYKFEDNLASRVSGVLQPMLGVQVTVTAANGLQATLYADDESTVLANPMTTDANGYFGFKAANGEYTLTFAGAQIETAKRNVELYDADDDPPLTLAQAAVPTAASRIGFQADGDGAQGRTIENKLRDTVSVKDFGAVGDGIADDTAAIQAALNSGARRVFSPAGTYLMGFVTIPAEVLWEGEGAGTIKKAAQSLPVNSPLVRNAVFASYNDTRIAIANMVFDGNGLGAGVAQTRFDSLLHFYRVTGLRLRNVTVQNYQYQGIALSACRRVTVSDPVLTGLGYSGTTSNGGSALWIGNYGADMCDSVNVLGGDIYANNWHGIHAAGRRININGGINFRDNGEAHIYAPRTLPDTVTTQLQISNFAMDGVRRRDISAHAIETNARNITISNGQITDCDHGGIALQNAQDVTVSGVTIWNVNKINGNWGGIDIITDNPAPNNPKNITITGCRVYDDQSTPTTQAAVRMQNAGAAVSGLELASNNFGGTFKTGAAAFQPNAKLGSGCKIKGNIGIADNPGGPVFGQFNATAAGPVAITGVGFKPCRLKIRAILPGASLKMSDGWVGPDGTMFSQGITATSTPAAYGSIGPYAVNITNGAGGAEVRATHGSYDSDGFTLNFSAVAASTWCVYEAYPD